MPLHPTFVIEIVEDGETLRAFTRPEPYPSVIEALEELIELKRITPFRGGTFRLECRDDGIIHVRNRRAISASQKTFHQLEDLAFKGSKALGRALSAVDALDIEGTLATRLQEHDGDLSRLTAEMVFRQLFARAIPEARRDQSWMIRVIWSLKYEAAKKSCNAPERFADWAFHDDQGHLPFPEDQPFAGQIAEVVSRRIAQFLADPGLRVASDIHIC